jgi:hypothetical protein
MKTMIGTGLVRRLAVLALAFCAFAANAVTVDVRPVNARAGDYITLDLAGHFPRHDFWVTEAKLWDIQPVRGSQNEFIAEVDIYYHWAPLYDGALSRTPFLAHVGLGEFDTAATIEVRVRYYPEAGLPYAFDPTIVETATVSVLSGSPTCGHELVLGTGTQRCTPNLGFGRHRFGERSVASPVVIRNATRDVMYLGDFLVNNADYGMTRRCGEALEPGEACEVMITFSPSIDGASPGRLVIPYSMDADAKPFQVAIVNLAGDADIGPVRGPSRGERVIEYHAASTGQYFLTANEREIALLDGADLGWRRTGVSFLAAGDYVVCRFFGDLVAGPRGHRYIARVDECEAARTLDRETGSGRTAYRYEGSAFSIGLPLISEYDGRYRCPDGSRPIYQFKRPAGGGRDLAYRLVPAGSVDGGPNGDDIARTLLQSGWFYEGHFMCSIPPEEIIPE